jgi:GNAT superfamily N-acetyltransferase
VNADAGFILRDAIPGDAATILRLVRALADYEQLLHEVEAGEEHLRAALFDQPPRAHAILAEAGGMAVGFGLWYYTFSTFTGRSDLYVEDVYVEPGHRGRGIGRAIFRDLARRALAAGCSRMHWSVLDWNGPAIAFYRSIGAKLLDDWTGQRLSGTALAVLAG